MFELQTFPARDGDCLILTWGRAEAPKRMMIDGGREGCWASVKAAVLVLPDAEREFELLVVTHIDADHIAGVLKMLADPDRPVRFKEVWFNSYHHLRPFVSHETFGAAQGDKLSKLLEQDLPVWNKSFSHNAVVVQDVSAPPRIEIEGLELILISPTPDKLAELEPEWRQWVEKERLKPGEPIAADLPVPIEFPSGFETFGAAPDVANLAAEPLPRDTEAPNGSSIAFIARYEGRSLLLAGDANADVTEAALANLPAQESVFHLVKLAHHGSRANLSAALASAWKCAAFVISTDGSRHHHPDPQTIARLIKARPGPKVFYFNHRHAQAATWDNEHLKQAHGYTAIYPANLGYLKIDISTLPSPT